MLEACEVNLMDLGKMTRSSRVEHPMSNVAKYSATKKSVRIPIVIPAEAGIQAVQSILDPGFCDGSFNGHFILWACTKKQVTEFATKS